MAHGEFIPQRFFHQDQNGHRYKDGEQNRLPESVSIDGVCSMILRFTMVARAAARVAVATTDRVAAYRRTILHRIGGNRSDQKIKAHIHLLTTLILTSPLVGCGGDGSGGGVGSAGGGGGTGGGEEATYTIGGTVTNLPQGAKLVLSDNGGDALTLSASGSFTFSQPVSAGGSYSVAVTTNPVAQQCSVTDGTGTGVSANVSDIQVNCASQETVLADLGGSNGALPASGLIQASDGNFYGVTSEGGANGTGTVFRIGPAASTSFTVLYSFGSGNSTDGQKPTGALVEANDGNLYGTTTVGGANGTGTVFRITFSGTESVLYSFGNIGSLDASNPYASLIQANDGFLYGTAPSGALNGTGAIFRVDLSGNETLIYQFGASTSTDAQSVQAPLIQATDGNLYGVSPRGGINGTGTIFRVSLAGDESVVHSFGPGAGADGSNPLTAGLLQASDGNFYGTTTAGGPDGLGTIFKMTIAGVESVLVSFTNANSAHGLQPYGGLIQGSDGNLYGTTAYGGTNGTGTVFSIPPSGVGSTLYSFGPQPGSDGQAPTGNLVQGQDGLIYGVTSEGGTDNNSAAGNFGGTVYVLQ